MVSSGRSLFVRNTKYMENSLSLQCRIPFYPSISLSIDCVGLTSPYEVAVLQDDSLNLLIESCGSGARMGHILLTLSYIRSAADRKIIQVNYTYEQSNRRLFYLFSI